MQLSCPDAAVFALDRSAVSYGYENSRPRASLDDDAQEVKEERKQAKATRTRRPRCAHGPSLDSEANAVRGQTADVVLTNRRTTLSR